MLEHSRDFSSSTAAGPAAHRAASGGGCVRTLGHAIKGWRLGCSGGGRAQTAPSQRGAQGVRCVKSGRFMAAITAVLPGQQAALAIAEPPRHLPTSGNGPRASRWHAAWPGSFRPAPRSATVSPQQVRGILLAHPTKEPQFNQPRRDRIQTTKPVQRLLQLQQIDRCLFIRHIR